MIELPTGTENMNYFGFRSSNGALYAAYMDYGDPEGRVQIVDAFERGGDVSQAASSVFAFTGLDSSKPHVLTVINLPDSRANNESTLTFDSLIVSVVDDTSGATIPPPLANVPQPSDDSPVNPGSPTGSSNPPSAADPGLSPGTNTSPDISSSPRPVTPPSATEVVVAGPPPSTPSHTPSPISPSPNLSPLGAGLQPVSQPQVPPAGSAQLPGPTASISAGAQPGPVPAASSPIPSQAASSGNGTPAPNPTASANGAGSPGVSVSGSSGPETSPISGTAGSTPTSGAGSQRTPVNQY
ncbi:hypothetical protein EWM64_g1324 [Hericium alpestre]|uniref:Uncharacterized protein n=1 Tax=Hericium alpestre TaxID=135208 RepID=A0A4Z0AAX0_9AGAM|nr:hypothetical protein EWM64_g1324 [Hericium alpestre]